APHQSSSIRQESELCTRGEPMGRSGGFSSGLLISRNTSVASLGPGQTATLAPEALGYEWDEDLDDGVRPADLVRLSTTTLTEPQRLLAFGSNYGPAPRRTASSSTRNRTARSCSAPAPCSGPGGSTTITIEGALRPTSACSRRRSISWRTSACSPPRDSLVCSRPPRRPTVPPRLRRL